MDALTAITSRSSAIRLSEPAPTAAQIETILQAGVSAPDHGRLSPWRFVVLEGEARGILGRAMSDLRRRRQPELTEDELAKEAQKVMRAPTIIVVAARPNTESKVPEIEQVMAVGAATQNMFLAAHAIGLGAMWKTGPASYDDGVKSALGLEKADQIIAFLYLGTSLSASPPRALRADEFVIKL